MRTADRVDLRAARVGRRCRVPEPLRRVPDRAGRPNEAEHCHHRDHCAIEDVNFSVVAGELAPQPDGIPRIERVERIRIVTRHE